MTGEVYVLGKDGEPLMPTRRFWRVRRLLKAKKARVVYRKPFTIQLLYDAPNGTQSMCGGIDPGRTNLGEAAIDEDGSVHYMAHAATRNKEIPKLMQDRAAHRRASRSGSGARRRTVRSMSRTRWSACCRGAKNRSSAGDSGTPKRGSIIVRVPKGG